MAANAYERAARAEKVVALTTYLHRIGANPERLEALTDAQWADLARLAGTKTPSTETRRQVIAAMQPATDGYGLDSSDPFAGIGMSS